MNTRLNALLVLTLFAVILSACAPQPPAEDLTPVTVQLKWIHQAQFAGFYMAVDKGFYAKEGLDVTLNPGGIGIDITDEVVSGRAEFGLIGAEYVLIRRSEGIPIKAIATTYRNNPFVLVSMPDSGITTPQDFPGHNANLGGIDGLIQFNALLRKLDIEDVEIIPYTSEIENFYNGEVDITPAFSAGSLIGIQQEYPDVNVIWPLDYGIHLYSDTIFTTDELIAEDPDLVLRFLRATLKGHQYALENLEEATEICLKYAEDKDPEVQSAMLEASLPLIYTGYDEIGWMRYEVWQDMYDILNEQELLAGPVNIEEAYTLEFLQQIYGDLQ